VYGLMGPKQFRNLGPVYDGFYIIKYDSKGNLQWRLQEKSPKKLSDYSQFRVHASPGQRSIALRFGGDHSLNFTIHARKFLAVFALNSEGKVVRTSFDDEFIAASTGVYMSTSPAKSEAYVSKFDLKGKKATNFFTYVLPDREIVLQQPFTGSDQLMLFKK
jgi:hypothetical protein